MGFVDDENLRLMGGLLDNEITVEKKEPGRHEQDAAFLLPLFNFALSKVFAKLA